MANQGQFIRSCTRAPVKLSNLIGNYFYIFSGHKHPSLSAAVLNATKRKNEPRVDLRVHLKQHQMHSSQLEAGSWWLYHWDLTPGSFSLIVRLMSESRSLTVTASFHHVRHEDSTHYLDWEPNIFFLKSILKLESDEDMPLSICTKFMYFYGRGKFLER